MDSDRICRNLNKTAELIDAVFTLKLALIRSRHPELGDAAARSLVYRGIVDRKERQWKLQRESEDLIAVKQLAGRPVDALDIEALREVVG